MVHEILMFLTGLGYWGILIGLMIEIIPSEIVLAYAGFLVQQGKIDFAIAVIFGVVGGTIAQIFIYWIGRYGGRPFLEKYGKYLLINNKQIDLAEEWFNRYGTGVIFTARFIPVVRHAISLPAGMARMSLLRFTVYTALAIIPWSVLFIYLGKTLGANWQDINTKAAPYYGPFILAAIVLTVIYFGYKLLRRKPQSNNPTQGYIGEKNTALELKALSGDYRVLHGRTVRSRGAAQDIDHLVIGSNGLFHIETKNWHGSIRFTEKGIERSQPEHHDDPTAQLTRHEFVLKELLRANKIEADVVGILNFADPQSEIEGSSPVFMTVRLSQLAAAIMNYRTQKPLDSEQIRTIVKLIETNSKPSAR